VIAYVFYVALRNLYRCFFWFIGAILGNGKVNEAREHCLKDPTTTILLVTIWWGIFLSVIGVGMAFFFHWLYFVIWRLGFGRFLEW